MSSYSNIKLEIILTILILRINLRFIGIIGAKELKKFNLL